MTSYQGPRILCPSESTLICSALTSLWPVLAIFVQNLSFKFIDFQISIDFLGSILKAAQPLNPVIVVVLLFYFVVLQPNQLLQ